MLRRVSKFKPFTAATTDTTVHEVSENRTLVVTNIIANNKESSAVIISLYDGASSAENQKLEITVPANSTKEILMPNDNGIEFTTSVVAQVSAHSNGSSIWIGGYED